MNAAERTKLNELLDRESIRQCLYTYCRGIDRCDGAALRASYWPDATDQHGAYRGSAEGFIDVALKVLKDSPRMIHMIGNVAIVLKGSAAAVESYFQAFQHDLDPAGMLRKTFLCGRYVDRFEKRGDEWRVAQRTVVYDWIEESPGLEGDDSTRFGVRTPNGKQEPGDPWYSLLESPPFSSKV